MSRTFFWQTLEHHGDAVALIDKQSNSYSYQQLSQMVALFAKERFVSEHFDAALVNTAKRQLVLLKCYNDLDTVVANLACLS
ncbi:MAG: hypothetical protein MJK04_11420, partial [Psychrosphaera sp.]|nr:hypothetical protein [Psychrosphaera sp.]